MKFEVKFTGERVTEESATHGDFEEAGWINPEWSKRTLYTEPEEVPTYTFDTLEEAESKIEEVIGTYHTDGRGSYYAEDSSSDYQTGDEWSYAGHITEVE